jgi:plasmid maintenance system antidote protein VapI
MLAISFSYNSLSGDELIRISDTQWHKDMKKVMHPGRFLRVYRENKGLTQAELGKALGGIPRQHISNMENGNRAISLKMARRLSAILDTSLERFIG